MPGLESGGRGRSARASDTARWAKRPDVTCCFPRGGPGRRARHTTCATLPARRALDANLPPSGIREWLGSSEASRLLDERAHGAAGARRGSTYRRKCRRIAAIMLQLRRSRAGSRRATGEKRQVQSIATSAANEGQGARGSRCAKRVLTRGSMERNEVERTGLDWTGPGPGPPATGPSHSQQRPGSEQRPGALETLPVDQAQFGQAPDVLTVLTGTWIMSPHSALLVIGPLRAPDRARFLLGALTTSKLG